MQTWSILRKHWGKRHMCLGQMCETLKILKNVKFLKNKFIKNIKYNFKIVLSLIKSYFMFKQLLKSGEKFKFIGSWLLMDISSFFSNKKHIFKDKVWNRFYPSKAVLFWSNCSVRKEQPGGVSFLKKISFLIKMLIKRLLTWENCCRKWKLMKCRL